MCGEPGMMIGAGVQGALQFIGGQQQSKAYAAQAQAQRDAAAQLERQRGVMAQNAALEKRDLKAKSDLVAGQNQAAFGAAGIDSSSGSGLDLLVANKAALRQDFGNMDFNLSEKDYEARQNIEAYNYGAKVSAHAAKQTKTLNALTSIIGTASSMYGISQKYKGIRAADSAAKTASAAATAKTILYEPNFDFQDLGLGYNLDVKPWMNGLTNGYFNYRRFPK